MVTATARDIASETSRDDQQPPSTTRKMTVGIVAQQRDTAHYVADMILELRNLAKGAKLHAVMVPLEYAYYEAFTAANRVDVPPDEITRINGLSQTLKKLEAGEPEDY